MLLPWSTITIEHGQEEVYYVSGGMLEVQPYYSLILADTVERAAAQICAIQKLRKHMS